MPSSPVRTELEELFDNDHTGGQPGLWRPAVEVKVYASSADADVPIANAHHCIASFAERGADVALIDRGDADHSVPMTRSLPLVLEQFERDPASLDREDHKK
jgi:hypothetical protein